VTEQEIDAQDKLMTENEIIDERLRNPRPLTEEEFLAASENIRKRIVLRRLERMVEVLEREAGK
jgi:hypothetical protein